VRGLLPGGGALIEDSAYGWKCEKCAKWVDMQLRKWDGDDQPFWWWYCAACRKEAGVGEAAGAKSKKQMANEKLATRCQKMTSFGHK